MFKIEIYLKPTIHLKDSKCNEIYVYISVKLVFNVLRKYEINIKQERVGITCIYNSGINFLN